MEYIQSVDGTEIAVERRGDGRPLLFLHGTGARRGSLRGVAKHLDGEYQSVLVDRRGRGESGDADEYALEREVEDVLAILEQLGEPTVLFGHSYGGTLSLEIARRTDALDRLVLYEPPLVNDESFSLEALRAAYESDGDRGALRSFWEQAIGEEHPLGWDEWLEDAPPGRTFLRESVAVAGFDAPDTIDVGAPTLSLVGTETKPSLRESARIAHGAIAESELVELDGHGHIAPATAPELVAEKIEAFLSE